MGHQPYESWLVSAEPLLAEDELKLHEHLASCVTCRQLSYSWSEVQDLFQEPRFVSPSPGFTGRWQSRLVEDQLLETEHKQKRISWIFFAATAGAAAILLVFMAVQILSSVQAPVQLFIGGLALITGFLNLASALQIALIPFLKVVIVSVPTYWWFIVVIAACLLTLVLSLSARRIFSPRRVSL
jgi:hypothetical protein